jgi:hypothetical protein
MSTIRMSVFDLENFPWPNAGEDLLDTSGSWTGHALLDWQRDVAFGRAVGFSRAAEMFVRHVLAHSSDLDFLVYPIANNWRHSLELRLKTLIVALTALVDEPPALPRGHDLMKLWREARAGIETAHPEEGTDALDHAEPLLGQLHALDPDGQNFRYYRRTDGSPALVGVDRLDIRAFHDGLTAVANLLSGATDQIGYDPRHQTRT